MKDHTEILVIGGGILGCSLLYHLARLGVSDCALVEKNELTAGTTWHSAACCTHFGSNSFLATLHQRTTAIYEELESITGQPAGFHKVGSVRLALDAEEMAECRRFAGMAKALGIPCELLGRDEIQEVHPLTSLEGVVGALYTPDDGHVDPAMSTQAFAIGARREGAQIFRNTEVTGLKQRSSGEWDVETENGTIRANTVVNTTGLWGHEINSLAGQALPIVAVELSYLVTEAIPEVNSLEKELPVLRGLDGAYYLRQERDGFLIGVYEETPVFWGVSGIPNNFDGYALLEGNVERLERSVTAAMNRLPVLAEAGIKKLICGPSGRTPDNRGLMGPVPGLTNFFAHTGVVAGFTQGAALGKSMAHWVVDGTPDLDLWFYDLRRFGPYADKSYTYERSKESFLFGYNVMFPTHEHQAARPLKTSSIYTRLAERGAVFGARNGWECPLMFVKRDSKEWAPTFGRPEWSDVVRDECNGIHKGVGVMDQTGTAAFEIEGAGAESFLDHMCAGPLPMEVGNGVEVLMLNQSGGIECYVTLARLGSTRFWMTAPIEAESHHLDWLQRHVSTEEISINNVTDSNGSLLVVGPRSSELLENVFNSDFFSSSAAPMSVQIVDVNQEEVRVQRCDVLGETGWELYHSLRIHEELYDQMSKLGDSVEVVDFGLRSKESLLLEMGRPRWKVELTATRSPLEAGLGHLVELEKGEFIGRSAVSKLKNEPEQILSCLMVDVNGTNAWLWGDETILSEEGSVGLTLSAGYGYRISSAVALAYLPASLSRPGVKLWVEVLGESVPARVVSMPAWSGSLVNDPQSSRRVL